MDQAEILYEKRDGIAVVTLNRPERLNAFTVEQHRLLRDALVDAEADEAVRVIVLTGAGRGFCAGQDLADRDPSMMTGIPDLGVTIDNWYNPLVRRLRALPKPVLCAVNGVAAGAGANIALSCDIVVAARSAKFIQAFSKIGLIPDAGGTYWLTRHLGEARAKALALTAMPLTAEQAADWGLIWKAVDDALLMDEVMGLAHTLADGPVSAYALTKRAIHAASTNALDAQLDVERDTQREAGRSGDYREGVSAFLEKRTPNYRG